MAEDRQPTTPETGAGSPRRVLRLTAPGRFGGLDTGMRLLAAGLTQRGHEVKVVCRLGADEAAAIHLLASVLTAAAGFGPGAWLHAQEALYRQAMTGASGRTERR